MELELVDYGKRRNRNVQWAVWEGESGKIINFSSFDDLINWEVFVERLWWMQKKLSSSENVQKFSIKKCWTSLMRIFVI